MKDHRRAERFFTKAEKEAIRKATAEAESGTIGEIAVMVVDHSSNYRETESIGGIFLGSLISLVITVLFLHGSLWWYVPLSFLLFFPCRVVFQKVPYLKTSFIPKQRKERAVRDRALRAFYEKGLYKTREHSGVLFFISLLERKVWVIADEGIHGKIRQPAFNKFAAMVSQGIREGRSADALCRAISEIGELLAQYYPAGRSDVDELPDGVMYPQEE
jgi:putative membrane protein